MQGSDVLTILAEIFVAFAGFTGIVATLGQRSQGSWRPVDVLRFQGLLATSLAGLVFSVAPFGFHHAGVTGPVIWGSGSALMAIYIVWGFQKLIRAQVKLRATEDRDYVPGVRLFLLVIAVPVVISQILNALGLGLQHTFSGFLIGLMFAMIMCCAMFVLLLRFIRVST